MLNFKLATAEFQIKMLLVRKDTVLVYKEKNEQNNHRGIIRNERVSLIENAQLPFEHLFISTLM